MRTPLIVLLLPCAFSGDPLQNILRDVMLSILSNLPISSSSPLMFQMDPKTSQALYSLNDLIERLSMGGPMYAPKTVGDLMRPPEIPHCIQLTVLADPWPTPFEWSHTSPMGKRTIIGQLTSQDGRTLNFAFGGDVELRTSLIYISPNEDILVLADMDAVPKCSNIMVLKRNQSFEGRLLAHLASQGMSPPSNPLLSVPCP